MSQVFISKVRSIVSADRRRFKVDDLDLDLSYITPNLVAMSFPSSGIESAYRNSIKDVCTLLNNKHGGKFMIWNLSERGYDYSKFNNQILDFPFPDHHAPNLNLLFEIVNSLDNWLKADPENIAVVHCKGGKGRTGTILCCYLYYSCYCATMEQALQLFATKRSKTHKGVTQPSQQRYINYFKEIVSGNYMIDVFTLNLVTIEMGPLTKDQANSMYLEIYEHEKDATLAFSSTPSTIQILPIDELDNKYKIIITIGQQFMKDVLIRVYKGKPKNSTLKQQLFHIIFNISFINLENSRKLIFRKKDLDHFKKAQKKFSDDFYIECIFQSNCTTLPDHSFQIWNIMALKCQQTRKVIKQKIYDQIESLEDEEVKSEEVNDKVEEKPEDGDDVEDDSSESNSELTTTSTISNNNINCIEKQQLSSPSLSSNDKFSASTTTTMSLESSPNLDSSNSSTNTAPLNSQTISYKENRMLSVEEVKQMILTLDFDADELNIDKSQLAPNINLNTITYQSQSLSNLGGSGDGIGYTLPKSNSTSSLSNSGNSLYQSATSLLSNSQEILFQQQLQQKQLQQSRQPQQWLHGATLSGSDLARLQKLNNGRPTSLSIQVSTIQSNWTSSTPTHKRRSLLSNNTTSSSHRQSLQYTHNHQKEDDTEEEEEEDDDDDDSVHTSSSSSSEDEVDEKVKSTDDILILKENVISNQNDNNNNNQNDHNNNNNQ